MQTRVIGLLNFEKYAYISYRILIFTLFQYLVEGQDTLRNSDLIANSKNWFNSRLNFNKDVCL